MEDNIELLEAIEQMLARFDIDVSLSSMTPDERDAWLAEQSERTQRIVESVVEMPELSGLAYRGDQSPGSLAIDVLTMFPAFRALKWGGKAAAKLGGPAIRLGRNALSRVSSSRTLRARQAAEFRSKPPIPGTSVSMPSRGERLARAAGDPRVRVGPRRGQSKYSPTRGPGSFKQKVFGTTGMVGGMFAAGLAPLGDNQEESGSTRTYEQGLGPEGEPRQLEIAEETLKNFYWDDQSTEEVGDKILNFVLGKGLPVSINRNNYESLLHWMSVEGGQHGIKAESLFKGENMQLFGDLIRANISELPQFQNWLGGRVRERLRQGLPTTATGANVGWATGVLRGNISPAMPASEEEIRMLESVIGSSIAGGIMTQEEAGRLFAGFLDESIDEYATDYAKGNPYLITYGEGDDLQYALPTFNDPFALSYDGSPFGTVHSLEDLFSGEFGINWGPLDIARYLEDLESRTKQPGAGSEIIAQLQQTLYSMNYLVGPDNRLWTPDDWGYLDQWTIKGMQALQMDLWENGMEARFNGIEPDVHALYREIADEKIRSWHAEAPTTATDLNNEYKNRVLEEAQTGILDAMKRRGLSLKPGSELYEEAVNEVITGMSGAEQEVVSGQGGSTDDAAAVSRILREFYGATDDWANHIEFGHVNPQSNNNMFINYASKTGALSQQELDDLKSYSFNPDHMARVRARHGQDVAVAHFLSFLDGESVVDASQDTVRNALIMYANTMGQGYAGRRGFSPTELTAMADRAYRDLPTDDPAGLTQLSNNMDERIETAMRINEHGVENASLARVLAGLSASSGVRTERARY